jgi:large subunit ribosomal protein L9
MEVLLTVDVQNLGKTGDVVSVKDGHARNYLFPRGMASRVTAANLKRIEKTEDKRRKVYEEEKAQAQALADVLGKISPTVSVEVNDQEKLYGSVSEAEILKAIELEGHVIDRKSLVLEKSIEDLGIFDIGVMLHPEVTAKVRLWITKK